VAVQGLLRSVAVEPGAALLFVLGQDKPDRLAAAAFAEESVDVAVCGSTRHGDNTPAQLVVERLRYFWGLRRFALLGASLRAYPSTLQAAS
jgi:hypothetical protein